MLVIGLVGVYKLYRDYSIVQIIILDSWTCNLVSGGASMDIWILLGYMS